jgi:hypothetical protein
MDFSFLPAPESPDVPNVAGTHDAMDCDVLSRCESTSTGKSELLDLEAYVPVNYISPEVRALLAAAEASAARRADAQECMGLVMGGPGCVVISLAPPRRFYKTLWRSLLVRLLDHFLHTARA